MVNSKIINVSAHEIQADLADNVSRILKHVDDLFSNKADKIALAESLASGWDVSKGTIGIYELSKNEVKIALKIRQDELISLDADNCTYELRVDNNDDKVSVNSSDILRHWKLTFCDKNGKVKTPKYGVVFGFRRFASLPLAIAASAKTVQVNLSYIPTVLVVGNKLARSLSCVAENGTKDVGIKSLNMLDKLSASNKLYEQGCLESALGKVFKRGSAQKLFGICRLNAKYANLKILDGILDKKIDMTIFEKEKVREINNSDLPEKEVKEWMTNPKKKNNDKVSKGKDIKALAAQSPVTAIKVIAGAIANDDIDSLAKLVDHKTELNMAWDAIMAGKKLIVK